MVALFPPIVSATTVLVAGTASSFFPESGDKYAVAPDGQRFLVLARVESRSTPVTVTINWPSALSKAN